ncbi:PTS sugar transporter subunit IIB [Clostridium sp.]|uniref:PTS sugar transporter subunit IIB n=1 Tax=Clostridium sp. TaxID=1506 RepID=UPI0025C4DF91|nr:PTS sugar transporter subunit IIB [Clostridium sp.]
MKKILLICSAGMSTSLLVNKMKESAKERNIEVDIKAIPISEAQEVVNTVDVILLGPQIRFQQKSVENMVEGNTPVLVIDMVLYGTMNGKEVLNRALDSIK